MAWLLLGLYYLLTGYFYAMIFFILLTWFPQARESKLYYYLFLITNPYLRIFRGVLVFVQMDFTPIVGFLLYSFGLQAFGQLVQSFIG